MPTPWRSRTCRRSSCRNAAAPRSSPQPCTRRSSGTRSGSYSSQPCSPCWPSARSSPGPSCSGGVRTTCRWCSPSRVPARHRGPSDTDTAAPSIDSNVPPAGLIAYVGVKDGQRVIRTVHPDGTEERTIAEGRIARVVPGRDHARVPVPAFEHARGPSSRRRHLRHECGRLRPAGTRDGRHLALVVTRWREPHVRSLGDRRRRHLARQPRRFERQAAGRGHWLVVAGRPVDPAPRRVGRASRTRRSSTRTGPVPDSSAAAGARRGARTARSLPARSCRTRKARCARSGSQTARSR